MTRTAEWQPDGKWRGRHRSRQAHHQPASAGCISSLTCQVKLGEQGRACSPCGPGARGTTDLREASLLGLECDNACALGARVDAAVWADRECRDAVRRLTARIWLPAATAVGTPKHGPLGAREERARVTRIDGERRDASVRETGIRSCPRRSAVCALQDAARAQARVDVVGIARVDCYRDERVS